MADKKFTSFRSALRHADDLKQEIDAHQSVAVHHRHMRATAAIHPSSSKEAQVARDTYKKHFDQHPKAAEYRETIRTANAAER